MSETLDMRGTIIPKSNQLNADDLLLGPITLTITNVSRAPTKEQPIAISYEGDGGKPYFPCKIMRRVLVDIWGIDANAYKGKSMTLFRDPKVLWGGVEVGGIRISAMSHMDGPKVLALAESKTVRKPTRIMPLVIEQKAPEPTEPDKATTAANALAARFAAVVTAQDYYTILDEETVAKQMQWLKDKRPELFAVVQSAQMAASTTMTAAPDAVATDGEMPG